MANPPTEDLTPWFQTLADVTRTDGARLEWSTFFEREQPVELDIGCGRGLFLVNASVENPDTNFLGIEIEYREGRRTARRLKKRALGNSRVLGGDAFRALGDLIEPHSVVAAHVYFPDPWWKKRHRKRRIFNERFLNLVSSVLIPGGRLHSWTDVEAYWIDIKALVDNHADFTPLPPPDERQATHDMDYQTSFERKKRKEGWTIYRGLWECREE